MILGLVTVKENNWLVSYVALKLMRIGVNNLIIMRLMRVYIHLLYTVISGVHVEPHTRCMFSSRK